MVSKLILNLDTSLYLFNLIKDVYFFGLIILWTQPRRHVLQEKFTIFHTDHRTKSSSKIVITY